MRRLRLALCLATLTAPALAPTAYACSVVPDYVIPNGFELVEEADAIVLARVGRALEQREEFDYRLSFVPETWLLGEQNSAELVLSDAALSSDEYRPVPSNPFDLKHANPEAFSGSCNRLTFDRNMLVLLFLTHDESGGYRMISHPFARTQEDVADENAPWVRLVRIYVEARSQPQDERRPFLYNRMETLMASRDPVDVLIALDIERTLEKIRASETDD